jgi:hypothetical protein
MPMLAVYFLELQFKPNNFFQAMPDGARRAAGWHRIRNLEIPGLALRVIPE